MAKISLICEQCGGNIILDNSHEIGTCEHCFSQFVIKQDQIVQKITQNITKHVYGYEGKDVEELLTDGYKLIDLGDDRKANTKFKQAINIDPNCWSAWLGYASTGGDRTGYLSVVPAYRKAYNIGSVVLLKDATKKLVIIGILQVNPSENKIYDYLGVPYPEGYVGSDNNFLFNHSDINDIIFSGYENPEREAFIKAMDILYNQKK